MPRSLIFIVGMLLLMCAAPGCATSNEQGGCDSNVDCAPGHQCIRNPGTGNGSAAGINECVATVPPDANPNPAPDPDPSPEQARFAGRILDDSNRAVTQVEVSINGTSARTDRDGAFSLALTPAPDARYVINVHARGYVPLSQIHVGQGATDLTLQLTPAQVIAFDPTEPVDLLDERNTRIVLPANALVDQSGNLPKGPVTVHLHTYDLLAESLVGNMEALDQGGNPVMLESVGAVSADFFGTDGTRYQLAPGHTAQITMELPPEITYSGPIPLWYYDADQGRWIEEGVGMVQDGMAVGTVSHFSVWNFDVKRNDPACIQITVPDSLVPVGNSVQARVVVGPPLPSVRNMSLERGSNAFYNLPPNTEIQLFVPPNAPAPVATTSSGVPWGGQGQPPAPFDVCDGQVTLPDTLSGQIADIATLQGRSAHAGITVEVRDSNDILVNSTTTDAQGRYSLDVPAGAHVIELRRPDLLRNFLSVRFDAVTVPSGKPLLLPCARLPGGDVDRDGDIDGDDLDETFARQGTSAPPGDPVDINGDGLVNGADLTIIEGNLSLVSPVSADDTRSNCGLPPVTAGKLAAGGYHTCVLQDGGAVKCWGNNSLGQLGYGHTNDIGDDETLVFLDPVDVGGPVRSLAGGLYHTCALLESGAVRCWGNNSQGQLGYGHTQSIGDDETPASAGDVDVGGTVVQIAAGVYHTCALLEIGEVRCWGANWDAQLGYGHLRSIGDDETPASTGEVEVGAPVIQLSAGYYHTCALLETGAVKCWGFNREGQLGYGFRTHIGDNETPASVGNVNVGGTVIQLTSSHGHTCALLETGAVRCWGFNSEGQLGYGHTNHIGDNETPASAGDVNVGGRALQLATGSWHTCIQLESGALRCWGENGRGQLGHGHTNNIGDDETPISAGDVPILN